MQNEHRKRLIIDKIQEDSTVDVELLAVEFKVSPMTIRRDLKELDKKGLIQRTHGGAIKLDNSMYINSNFDLRINNEKSKKIEICKKAAQFVEDGDILFIDCGTTLFHLSKLITGFKNIKVITNSIPVVSELLEFPNIKVSLIGGEVDSNRKATYGKKTEDAICEYHATKAFIGADGVSIQGGISSYDEKESTITKNMALNAEKVFLLCDSSKIGRNSFVKFLPASILNYLITDSELDTNLVEEFKNQNIKIVY
jgi:DeoR family transcriptional regulator, fructose operon transcriptional repressor